MDERTRKKIKPSWLVGCNSRRDLPVDMLIEVLKRLPFKRVLACMFVSKRWCSIIRQPSFIEAYRSRNPFCLILSAPLDVRPVGRCLYWSNLAASGHEEECFNLFEFSWKQKTKVGKRGRIVRNWRKGGATQVINGLFCCFVYGEAVLVNAFTREVTTFPSAAYYRALNLTPGGRKYLGFEPTSGLYKLLFIDPVSDIASSIMDPTVRVDIFTFDGRGQDFSWKTVRCPLAKSIVFYLGSDSISVGGVLYWFFEIDGPFEVFYILSFDLRTERFEILNTYTARTAISLLAARAVSAGLPEPPLKPYLVEFRGKLALFYANGKKMIIHPIDNSEMVDEVTLPEELQGELAAIPVGNLSTGQLLIANLNTSGSASSSATPVYAYHEDTNTFQRFVVGKFPSPIGANLLQDDQGSQIGHFVSCVDQNTAVLDALIRKYGPSWQ